MQTPPPGYKVGRGPAAFVPYYRRPGAGVYSPEKELTLPQLGAARSAGTALRGGRWDPSLSYEANAGGLLDLFAVSLLEDEAADLKCIKDITAPCSTRYKTRILRPSQLPTTMLSRIVFERPLMWVPISDNASGASTSTHTSADLPSPNSPCMFMSSAKMSHLANKRTGIRDGQLGYANLLLGTYPANHGISEGVHRLVNEFIMGPSPAITQMGRTRSEVAYPKGGYWVCCHICGNKSCINPIHLVWGSEADNTGDQMDTYKRLAKEQGHPEWSLP